MQIEAIDDNGRVVRYFASQGDAKAAGYSQQAISACLAGRRKNHKGLAWRPATGLGLALHYLTEHTSPAGVRPVHLGELIDKLPAGSVTIRELMDLLPYTMHSDETREATVDAHFWV